MADAAPCPGRCRSSLPALAGFFHGWKWWRTKKDGVQSKIATPLKPHHIRDDFL
jgi:hypothetical protein